MRKQEILDRLREILWTEFEVPGDRVVMEALLAEDLDLDSLDIVALTLRLQEETGLVLQEEELASIHTVGQVLAVLREHFSVSSA